MIKRVRFYDDRIAERLAAVGRDSYDAIVAPESGGPVHERSRTVTYRVPLPDAGPDESAAVYVKLYRPGLRGVKFLGRPSKAWVEAQNLRRLAGWGVPTVRVVGVGSHRTWFGLAGAFLITAEWPGASTLAHHAAEHWPVRGSGPAPFRDFQVDTTGPLNTAGHADQAAIGRLLADAVAAMHRRHFYHIDLQWRNVLVRQDPPGRWHVALIDCPRGGRRWTIPTRRHGRVSDLASLDRLGCVFLTRTERLRWLKRYLGVENRKLRPADRRLARRVLDYRNRFEHRRHPRTAGLRRGDKVEPLRPGGLGR